MKNMFLYLALFASLGFIKATGQTRKDRAEQLAAQFNKEKNKYKEKNGGIIEKHVTIEARPDYRENINTYAATYEMEGTGQYLTLNQSTSGEWQAVFSDETNGILVNAGKLTDVKIDDALLTGTLITPDGKKQAFEAVFINRFVNGEPAKGLGTKTVLSLSNGLMIEQAFYKRKE